MCSEAAREAAAEGGFAAVHTPVLVDECLALLGPRRAGSLLADGTLGEGGHSEAFLRRFPDLRIIGIDADADILKRAKKRLAGFGDRIEFYHGWSQDFFGGYGREGRAPAYPGGARQPDSILLDLGVSLYHYEEAGRGFSFRKDEPLDMRIDPARGQSAAGFLAEVDEAALADLLFRAAGERYSRRIARAIVEARRQAPIATSAALEAVVWGAVPAAYRHGSRSHGNGLHPATRTFAALRIAVNGELARLPALLDGAFAALAPGGRLGVITFHSAEDRLVKQAFRAWATSGEGILVTRKPAAASEAEVRRNPPSRGAKLRVVERRGT